MDALHRFSVAVLVVFSLSATALPNLHPQYMQCKYISGDKGWPSHESWQLLNTTVGGRLIATVPLAKVCHNPFYNATACSLLGQVWDRPETHIFNPASIMNPIFQNQSCDPYTPESKPCTLGNYVSYAINVSNAKDAAAGVIFAQEHNIRLVIKNTGHDYSGKSTGKGGLSLWMHNLNTKRIIRDYKSKAYRGAAIKLGAGILGEEALLVAKNAGYRILAGSCPTVGITGGYSQGAGHSLLSSSYGLAADDVLEREVVTANGTYLVVSPTQNTGLYWALSGGGGGTFAVVLSMTSKLHKDGPIAGASLSFTSASISQEKFWDGINAFHSSLEPIVDSGNSVLYQITDSSFGAYSVNAPDKTPAQLANLLKPFSDKLTALGIPFSSTPSYFDTYYDHYSHYYGPLPFGPFPVSQLTTSRLIPRNTAKFQSKALGKVLEDIVHDNHFYLGCFAFNANNTIAGNKPSSNAVLPAWRDALLHCIVVGPWDYTLPRSEMLAREEVLTNTIVPSLEALTPGSGTYMNEANFAEDDFQKQFYGANYPRLKAIKKKHDPNDLFYAITAVGSEAWTADSEGRLCRS